MAEQTRSEQSVSERPPRGMVTISCEIQVPIEAVVRGWTKAEAARLVAGDLTAREELVSQAFDRRDLWSGFDLFSDEVRLDGGTRI